MDTFEQYASRQYIEIKWYVADILTVRPDLNLNQALNVLFAVKNNHNPETGINWAVIRLNL